MKANDHRKDRNPNTERTLRLLHTIFLCLITIAACAGAVLMLYRLRIVTRQLSSTQQELEEQRTANSELYTKAELDAAAAKAEKQGAQDAENAVLTKIQSSLESGNSTTAMLRTLFSDDLVVLSDGKYYFFPVYSSLEKSTVSADDFSFDEAGRLTYTGSDTSVSTRNGIDISQGNGEIDFASAADEGISFCMVRAGTRNGKGVITQDSRFDENMQGALDAGLAVGVYYDLGAVSEEEAQEEADALIQQLSSYSGRITYPVAVTVRNIAEGNRLSGLTRSEWTANLRIICSRIEEAGYTPMIYGTLVNFVMKTDLASFESCEKWVADYSDRIYFPYKFSLWQYSTTGQVQGINGNVHLDLLVTQQ